MKLPFGRGTAGSDLFGDIDAEDEKLPSLIASLLGLSDGDSADDATYDDEEEAEGRKQKTGRFSWPVIAGSLVGVGVVGGLVGYWAFGSGGEPVVEGGVREAAVVELAMPPRSGSETPGTSLLAPPLADPSSSDRSPSRRPWLTGGGAEPAPHGSNEPASKQSANGEGGAEKGAAAPKLGESEDKGKATEPKAPAGAVGGEAKPAPSSDRGAPPTRLALVEPPIPVLSSEPEREPPSYDHLPKPPKSEPLVPAPLADLVNKTDRGLLPVVSGEGKQPWKAYARPFSGSSRRPRVAIIITELGLQREATEAAIERLPADVTLSFSPYADGLKRWIERARERGHEVMLDMPMEPNNFPIQDPGSYGLLTVLSPQENIERLETVLGRCTGYTGIVAYMGSRFLTKPTHFLPVLMALADRGLIYVDNGVTGSGVIVGGAPPNLNYAMVNLVIDERPFAAAINARLDYLANLAKTSKRAVGTASAYPVTMDRMVVWIASLEGKGISIAPLSALVQLGNDK
ncbi:MAG: divergent polysaccharide deacetylase family protein [Alphaproteobacteria bacterium]|nr:divergent polysaccharide deacetylase family protein [Alphaproteobacteria bacterium]